MLVVTPKPTGICIQCEKSDWYWHDLMKKWTCKNCFPYRNGFANYVEPDYPGKPIKNQKENTEQPIQESLPLQTQESKPGHVRYSKEIEELRLRIANGTKKLNNAFPVIRKMPIETEEEKKKFRTAWNAWADSSDTLRNLGEQLQKKGFWDCLFIGEPERYKNCNGWPNEMWCYFCPMMLPNNLFEFLFGEKPREIKHHRTEDQKATIKFLKTLGGKI